ncbi:MAG TPA: PGPGW domain-containing protein [Terriglobia bacterium]|nr:PGPGW domain-containing protein [Terriglobia bacterium]
MAGKRNRSVVLLIGWGLILLGVLGLLLPILPGMVLLLAGVSVLSSEYVWAHKILQRLRDSFPKFSQRLREAETWARNRFR